MGEPPAQANRSPRDDRARRCAATQRIHHPRCHHRRLQRRPYDPHGARLYRKPRRRHQTHPARPRRQRNLARHPRRDQRQHPARAIRPPHPAGRRSPHHGALFPRRHLARLGRNPRSRQAPDQPRPNHQTRSLRPDKGTPRSDKVEERSALTQTSHHHRAALSPYCSRCRLKAPSSDRANRHQPKHRPRCTRPIRQHSCPLRPRCLQHDRPARRRCLRHRPLLPPANATRQDRDHAPALSRFARTDPITQSSQGEPER
jgi:hypothetical protein